MPLTNEQIIRKWGPIMESMGVKEDRKKRWFSEYAEHHLTNDVKLMEYMHRPLKPVKTKITRPDIDTFGEENWEEDEHIKSEPLTFFENTLPMSLKVLSKLNLEDKNFTIEEGMPNIMIKCSITYEQFQEMGFFGIDLIDKIQNTLMNVLINRINEELETKNNLRVTSMVQEIKSVIDENTMMPTIVLMSRYRVD